jgi:hypothetical protein
MRNDAIFGSLPSQIAQLSNITLFAIQNPSLTGNIPSQVGLMTGLDIFAVGGGPRGSIPSELGSLTKAGYLGFIDTSMSGSIPSEIGRMTSLGTGTFGLGLYFTNTMFTGSLPSQLGLLTSMETCPSVPPQPLPSPQLDHSELLMGRYRNTRHLALTLDNDDDDDDDCTGPIFAVVFSDQICGEIPSEVAALTSMLDSTVESFEWSVNGSSLGTPCCEVLEGLSCAPTSSPTTAPTTFDTVRVDISLTVTAAGAASLEDENGVKTAAERTVLGFSSDARIVDFQLTATAVASSGRILFAGVNTGSNYFWDATFGVVSTLASTASVTSNAEFGHEVTAALSTPSFGQEVGNNCPTAVLEVQAAEGVTVTRSPTLTPTACVDQAEVWFEDILLLSP